MATGRERDYNEIQLLTRAVGRLEAERDALRARVKQLEEACQAALAEATRTPSFDWQANDPTFGTLSHETIDMLDTALSPAAWSGGTER